MKKSLVQFSSMALRVPQTQSLGTHSTRNNQTKEGISKQNFNYHSFAEWQHIAS